MKKTLLLLIFSIQSIIFVAQSSDNNYALGNDSIVATQSIVYDSIYEFNATLDSLIHDYYITKAFMPDCDSSAFEPVFFSDSIYIDRLQKLPYVVPMPYNQIVKQFIEMYAKRHSQVSYMLAIGHSYYFSMFEQSLAKYNVPLELCYLPIIESALNARAVSHAGAAGLWQFMIKTGRAYGLEVNSLVDERCDPVKSTDAAARYLSDLYKIYGDWLLVIAAYNCGPGNVAKAIRYSNDVKDYWTIYPYLPRETRSYVPIFIAANYIMNYFEEHKICPALPLIKYSTDTVMVKDRIHLQQVADVLQIPMEELRFLNPQYRRDIIPGNIKPYPLMLPLDKLNAYSFNHDSILNYKSDLIARQLEAAPKNYYSAEPVSGGKYYRVKKGDTLGGIAKRHGISVSKLKKMNNLKSNMIQINQKLRVR